MGTPVLIILLGQVLLGTLFGAVFLRLGCWIFNKMAGRTTATSQTLAGNDPTKKQPVPNIRNVSSVNKDDKNPFAAPGSYVTDVATVDGGRGVPTPSFLKAMAIMFAYSITGFAIGVGLGIMLSFLSPANGQTARSAGITVAAFNFASVFINFCVLGVIVRYALPTTFGKAAIVTILTAVSAIILALVVFVPILLFSLFFGLAQ